MSRDKGGVLAILLAGLSLFVFCQAFLTMQGTPVPPGVIDGILSEELTLEQVKEILKIEEEAEEGYSLVFWKEAEEMDIQWKETGKKQTGSVIRARGQINLLAGGNQWLENQQDECLISGELASKLFGSQKVEGAEITVGKQKYRLRDLADQPEELAVIPATEGTFDRVRIKVPDGQRDQKVWELLQSRHGLPGKRCAYPLLQGISWLFVCLLPVAVFLHFILWALAGIRQSTSAGGKLVLCVAVIGAVLWGSWMLAGHVRIPLEMLPTKWSDFTFWQDLFKNQTKELQYLLSFRKSILDQAYMTAKYRAIMLGILALGLYFVGIICYTMRRTKGAGTKAS